MESLNLSNINIYVSALFSLAAKAHQDENEYGSELFQVLMPFMLSQDRDVHAKFQELFNEYADSPAHANEAITIYEAAETMIACPLPLRPATGEPGDDATFSFFSLGVFAPGLESPLLTEDQIKDISAYFRKTHQIHFSSEVRVLPALIPLDTYLEMPWPDLFKTACLLCDKRAQIEVVPSSSPNGLYALMAVAEELRLPENLTDPETVAEFENSPFPVSNAIEDCLAGMVDNWQDSPDEQNKIKTIQEGGHNLLMATMAKFDEILGTPNVMLSGIPQQFSLTEAAMFEFRLSCLVTLQMSQILSPDEGLNMVSFEDTYSLNPEEGFMCNVRHVRTQQIIGQIFLENDSRLFDSVEECSDWYQDFLNK